jgi:hypothetical protein
MGDAFMEAGGKTNCSFTIVDDGAQRKHMEEVGFVVVKEEVKRVSLGRPKIERELTQCGDVDAY